MYIYPLINPSGCWRYWTFSLIGMTICGHASSGTQALLRCLQKGEAEKFRSCWVLHSEERIWKFLGTLRCHEKHGKCWKFSNLSQIDDDISMLPAIELLVYLFCSGVFPMIFPWPCQALFAGLQDLLPAELPRNGMASDGTAKKRCFLKLYLMANGG